LFFTDVNMATQNAAQLIQVLGLHPQSAKAKALLALSQQQFKELEYLFDMEEDDLIHVDSDGFTINHGSVGTKGIRYDFSKK
jgi:hypothetical protein